MLSISSYSCHISDSLKCDRGCSHTSLWADVAFFFKASLLDSLSNRKWTPLLVAAPLRGSGMSDLREWGPYLQTGRQQTLLGMTYICPLKTTPPPFFYSQLGLYRVQDCEPILPFSPLIPVFPLESSSLELISGFLLKCSLFSFFSFLLSDMTCVWLCISSFYSYSSIAFWALSWTWNVFYIAPSRLCTLFKMGCLQQMSAWLPCLTYIYFFFFFSHRFVSIDSESRFPRLPFLLIKLSLWSAQFLQVRPQTASSSAGGVCSAKLLLRHCAAQLPLLHFLNLFLTHHPPNFLIIAV